VILACNQTTGINSIIGYNTTILYQAGLSDQSAHWGYVLFTLVNFLLTIVGVMLVDRKGRKFLLSVGSAGIILTLVATALVFLRTENHQGNYKAAFASLVQGDALNVTFDQPLAEKIGLAETAGEDQQLTLVYSYGDFSNVEVRRLSDLAHKPITATRDRAVPANRIIAFFSNPLANFTQAKTAPLLIRKAAIGPVPSAANGWLVAALLFVFVSFFAAGPGVCVWLALSELMPTRIRSNGMSIALLINQGVSTIIASIFLPVVGSHGYAAMFFFWAACTVVYFIAAAFFLPETKGKTLEEIEEYFEGKRA
jgi:MFS family permease